MESITQKYREGLSYKESFLLSSLARADKMIFTLEDANNLMGESTVRLLSNLVKKKRLLKLKRGLYIAVPLDIGVKGADNFILHNFVIASKLVDPYYIGYWSALNHYGFSDQIPSTTFIATTIAKKPLEVLDSPYVFVHITNSKYFGTVEVDIEGAKIKISDSNKTIADCLDHPEFGGGLDEIARSIYFSIEEIEVSKIVKYAIKMENITIIKRLGYILESCELLGKYIKAFNEVKLSKGYGILDPASPRKGNYNEKWLLRINIDIKPGRWMY